jgi:hypothetical protein
MKSSSQWRQLIKFDRIDACSILKGINVIPFLKSVKDMFFRIAPNLPKVCPVMPQTLSLVDAIIVSPQLMEEYKILFGTMSATLIPNGVYRNVGKCYTDKDPEGFLFYAHSEIYFRLNDDVF